MTTTLLRNARLADGSTADVRLAGGLIAEVAPSLPPAPPAELPAEDDEAHEVHEFHEVHDLAGWLLLPAPAEPHAHLDKALTADVVDNPRGDLLGAVAGWEAAAAAFPVADFAARARAAALRLLAAGCTAVRSHVNVGGAAGFRAVDALVAVRDELRPIMDVQLVALVGVPTDVGLLCEALDRGVDVVGGCPHLDPDPAGCIDRTVAVAAARGLRIDLHMDETLDRYTLWVRHLARVVAGGAFDDGPAGADGHRATASHCVSLGMQDETTQAVVAAELAGAGVAVVTLPQTNLYLQARGIRAGTPRGLTALRPLLDAGVTVAGGADNLQDPFNTVGRGDPLETAALLVMAGHMTPDDAYAAVTAGARRALGLQPVRIAPGSPAELLAVRAPSLRAAIADAPADRMVFAKGRLVARTLTDRTVAGDLGGVGDLGG
jgi:cytosine/creatinine deaminase